MFSHSPITAPAARETAHIMVPSALRPLPWTVNIFSKAPEIPMNMTARPMACMMVS